MWGGPTHIFAGSPTSCGTTTCGTCRIGWPGRPARSTPPAACRAAPRLAPIRLRRPARYVAPHRWDDFIVPIAEVERQAGIRISLPAGISRVTREPAWPVDHGPWTLAHQAACALLR